MKVGDLAGLLDDVQAGSLVDCWVGLKGCLLADPMAGRKVGLDS